MSLTQAPIIVPSAENTKKFNYCEGCRFEYNYSLANLSVTKQEDHLEIKTGTEDQKYEIRSELLGDGINSKGKIHKIKIYCPALNNYTSTSLGKDVKAELIIEHESSERNGRTLSVCIPISKVSENANEDSLWLNKIINRANGGNRGKMVPITGPFTLNKLIPRSQYIVLENTNATWTDRNNTKNDIIIMTTRGCTVSAKALNLLGGKDVVPLSEVSKGKEIGIISAKGDNVCSVDPIPTNCQRFTGDDNPFADSKKDEARITISTRPVGEPGINLKSTMTCYPIDTDGNIIKSGYLASPAKEQQPLKDGGFSETAKVFLISLGIIAGVILGVMLIRKVGGGVKKKLNMGQKAGLVGATVVGKK